jgi:ubiquinone/menaquinone biosynthesis C-methylase UbiE
MDYDKTDIAAVYDSGRGYDPGVMREWLNLLSARVPKDGVSRIVDLGCGTGRFTEALSIHFDADVIGIDPSGKMLERARAKTAQSSVTFKQGAGEHLPLEDNSADMVFMSMVYHHLPDSLGTARESHRILREGGHVCIRNSTIDAIESFPYLKFFDGIRAIIAKQSISRSRIESDLVGAGFKTATHETVAHLLAPDWTSYTDKLAKRADSFLARLPDEDFQAGIAALRAHAEQRDPGEPVTMDVDCFVFQR